MPILGKGKHVLRRVLAAFSPGAATATAPAPEPPAAAPSKPDPRESLKRALESETAPPRDSGMPVWTKGGFSRTPEEEKRASAVGDLFSRASRKVKSRPLTSLGAGALLLLLLTADLASLARRLHVSDWLPISLDPEARFSREGFWGARSDGLALVNLPKGLFDPAVRSAVSGRARVPLASWELPPRLNSLAGIMMPEEMAGPRDWRRRSAVQGLDPARWGPGASAPSDMGRTRVAPEGSEARSPFGPAYPGVLESAQRANRIARPDRSRDLGAFAQVMQVSSGGDYRGVDSGGRRDVPKGAGTENLAEEMLEDGDLLRSLRNYAKSTEWKSLKKTNEAPQMRDYDGRRLLESASVAQLLETKRNADASIRCALCPVEDRVTDNRATYFGEKY